jgi:two-component system chemotaxis response regulator CheB
MISRPVVSPGTKAAVLAAESEARGADVEVICIAASTGGPTAIQRLVSELPYDLRVPIIVVQHMPAGFTAPFAERLNSLTHYTVQEGRDGQPIRRSHIYIAPAGSQTSIKQEGGGSVLSIQRKGARETHSPSADHLFESAAVVYGSRTLAVVLTGMGEDGACGAAAVREVGGHVIVESNESAIVFGMPRAVLERGCASVVLPLSSMPSVLLAYALKE